MTDTIDCCSSSTSQMPRRAYQRENLCSFCISPSLQCGLWRIPAVRGTYAFLPLTLKGADGASVGAIFLGT